jgi:hypothetical protein
MKEKSIKLSWLRDPLFHFLLLGSAIFVIDAVVAPGADDARVIRVDETLRAALAAKFEQSANRVPEAAELNQLVDGWVRREVLYREGLAMGLDRSDGFIRQRVIALVQALTINKAGFETPADGVLEDYFEENRQAFARPRSYTFEHFMIRDSEPRAGAAAERLLRVMATGDGDRAARRRPLSVRGRTAAQVGAIFGERFPGRLDALPVGQWQVVRSKRGWHVLRIEKIDPGGAPSFAAVRPQVLDAWRQNEKMTQAARRYRAMRDGYTIVDEGRETNAAD